MSQLCATVRYCATLIPRQLRSDERNGRLRLLREIRPDDFGAMKLENRPAAESSSKISLTFSTSCNTMMNVPLQYHGPTEGWAMSKNKTRNLYISSSPLENARSRGMSSRIFSDLLLRRGNLQCTG